MKAKRNNLYQSFLHQRSENGLTIIELMVAVVLLSMLTAGALTMVLSQSKTTNFQQEDDSVLENTRIVLDALIKQLQVIKGGLPKGRFVLNDTAPSGGFFCDGGICGAGSCRFYPVIYVTNSTTGPDTLRILVPDGSTWGSLVAAVDNTSTQVIVRTYGTETSLSIVPGDYVLLTDFQNDGVLFKATAVTANNNCSTTSTTNVHCITKAASGTAYPTTMAAGTMLLKARWLEYSVNTTTKQLMVKDLSTNSIQPSAPGIDDLQIAVGYDMQNPLGDLGNDIKSVADDDDWVYNIVGESFDTNLNATVCDVSMVLGVRVSIVAKANSLSQKASQTIPNLEDHAGGGSDNLYRVTMQSIAAVQ